MKKERALRLSILASLTVLSLMLFAPQFTPLNGADLSQITFQIDGMT